MKNAHWAHKMGLRDRSREFPCQLLETLGTRGTLGTLGHQRPRKHRAGWDCFPVLPAGSCRPPSTLCSAPVGGQMQDWAQHKAFSESSLWLPLLELSRTLKKLAMPPLHYPSIPLLCMPANIVFCWKHATIAETLKKKCAFCKL